MDSLKKKNTETPPPPPPPPPPRGMGNLPYNEGVLSEMNAMYQTYKDYPGIDCSEIAEDLYKASGGRGKIYNIQPKNSDLNKMGMENLDKVTPTESNMMKGYAYGKQEEYLYHNIYSDGVYVYDPRYSATPVLKDDYFKSLSEINSDGLNVYEVKP
ncbi:hypothetical protein D3C81_1739400 [compost metagenome]